MKKVDLDIANMLLGWPHATNGRSAIHLGCNASAEAAAVSIALLW